MRVEVLGPLRVLDGDGNEADLGGPRQRRLLVTLLARGGRTVPLDEVVDRVWDDRDRPAQAERAVRTYVSRLRSALGEHAPALVTEAAGYRLDVERCSVDANELASLVEEAAAARRRQEPAGAARSAQRALALVRGQPFGDLGDLDWLRPEVERLRELAVLAAEERAEALLEAGAAETAASELAGLHLAHPLRERPLRLYLLALYRCGRQPEALRAYQAYRRRLATDLGLEPSSDVVDLESRIAAGDQALQLVTRPVPLRGYRLHERLGEGAFSIVYRGTQPSVGRDVAIKQMAAAPGAGAAHVEHQSPWLRQV